MPRHSGLSRELTAVQWHTDAETIKLDISKIGAAGATEPCTWHIGLVTVKTRGMI